ncbi:unnamed protein product [Orchesella dallaii]|uniref:Uncharacterized protein n=1 Tax=Orchesella dallaii TaxID=48710 RepID=A0ABP1R8B6_9HEXA
MDMNIMGSSRQLSQKENRNEKEKEQEQEHRRVFASFGFPRGERVVPQEVEVEEEVKSLETTLANLGIELGSGEGKRGYHNHHYSGSGSGQSSGFSSPRMGRRRGGRGGGEFSRESSDLSARAEARSARLEVDISRRISGVSNSMEQYDKAVESYRKSVQDIRRRRSKNDIEKMSTRSPSPSSVIEVERKIQNSKNNQKSRAAPPVEIVASPRKVFGLDASSILESSSSSSEEEEEEERSGSSSSSSDEETDVGEATMRISIKKGAEALAKSSALTAKAKGKAPQRYPGRGSRGKVKGQIAKVRSLSPIMPELPDKQFQTILERREERVSRQLSSMKTELAQLNHKVEMDRRRASTATSTPTPTGGASTSPSNLKSSGKRRGKTDTSYKGRPMRLMKVSDSVNLNELSEFLQSTGGKAGGWERKDHNLFLKQFQTWRNHPNKLMEVLKKELPSKKLRELASHIKWFEEYEELQKKNKLQVHKWSIEKRRENEMVFEMGSEIQRAKMEGEKRRQEQLRLTREQEKDKGKEKLAQWKQKRRNKDGGRENENGIDVAGVRQHILDITAKVHALDNPKRDFRPPRGSSGGGGGAPKTRQSSAMSETRLPEVEPERSSSRPGSSRKSAPFPPPRGSHSHHSMSQFQERDERLVEARRKAVQIARERRKGRLSQELNGLTAEQVRKRAQAQAQLSHHQTTSTMLNPTKLSELRKSLTHLEKLEALSKNELPMGSGDHQVPRFDPAAFPPISITRKLSLSRTPSWRKADV